MAIPKILHQTYRTKELPAGLGEYRRKLIDLHPGWDYRFYGDDESRDVVERHFPSFLPVCDGCAASVQKADIFRIIAVYALGGFYLDIDVECLKSLDQLCEFHCVFAEELTITRHQAKKLGHRDRLRVANYMFGSEPGHPFLLYILRKMAEESRRRIRTRHDVMESTGPGLVTTVYHDLRDELRDVVLLPNRDRICRRCGGVSCHFGNFARHAHAGSWGRDVARNTRRGGSAGKNEVDPALVKDICGGIDSRIGAAARPEHIYVLRTYGGKPYDGLSYVYERTGGIGVLTEDTSRLSGKKVLVSGMPALYTDKISPRNLNVVYTTFESDRLPPFWVEALNKQYQHCIVPHPHVKRIFEESGVSIPVSVIHQGFTRYSRLLREPLPGDTFRIGFLGVPYGRKNLFKLYQACVNLSAEIPGLRLAVHAARLFRYMLTSETYLVKLSPFVEWTEGPLSEDEVAGWYGRLACYVYPSSGEGWSFTPRESLYLGIPTLVTDIPVHRELTESGYCGAIPVDGKEDAVYEGRVFGKWDGVRVKDIENSIMDMYRNYGRHYVRAIEGSRWIENKWTNESSRQMLLDFLLSL